MTKDLELTVYADLECPKCGWEFNLSHYGEIAEEEEIPIQCDKCGAIFEVKLDMDNGLHIMGEDNE